MSLLIQRRRCCCGDPEPVPCEVCPDEPALICPPKTGLSVTVSGVTLVTTTENSVYEWNEGASISGVFCLHGDGCDANRFTSLSPVKTGIRDPEGAAEPIALYLTVVFVCGISGFGPGVKAFIAGSNTTDAVEDTEEANILAFSTSVDGADTYVAWSRTCDYSGYTINNAITAYGPDPSINYELIGKDGTVATGGECGGGTCGACVLTAVTAEFTGGVLDGMTFDFDQGVVVDPSDACGYSFDDGVRFSGVISPPLASPFDHGSLVGSMIALQMRIFDQDSPTPLVPVFNGWLFCDGEGDPVLGRYGQDFPNPDPLGDPANGPTYPGVWTPTIYCDVT